MGYFWCFWQFLPVFRRVNRVLPSLLREEGDIVHFAFSPLSAHRSRCGTRSCSHVVRVSLQVHHHWRHRCVVPSSICDCNRMRELITPGLIAGVGKSCLLLQFTDKRFQPVHDLTIGECFFVPLSELTACCLFVVVSGRICSINSLQESSSARA